MSTGKSDVNPGSMHVQSAKGSSLTASAFGADLDYLNSPEQEHVRQRQAVLAATHKWDPYLDAQQLDRMKSFDKAPEEEQIALLQDHGPEYGQLFMNLLAKVNQDQYLKYVLTLVENIITDQMVPNAVDLFLNAAGDSPFQSFLRLLDFKDGYIVALASKLVSILMFEASTVPEQCRDLMFRWVLAEVRSKAPVSQKRAVHALMYLLQRDEYRTYFQGLNGLDALQPILAEQLRVISSAKAGGNAAGRDLQLIYELVFVLWLLSFNESVADTAFTEASNLIRIVVKLLQDVEKEKVRRVGLAMLANLLGHAENEAQMIHAGFFKICRNLCNKRWEDPEIKTDLEVLSEAMDVKLLEMSSWDRYKQEVLSGNLEWSPSHKSEKFWRENVHNFDANGFTLLGVLTQLLESEDPEVQAIACFDIGEFARFHPMGKRVIAQHDIKLKVMQLVNAEHEDLQRNALLCLQKLMVQNWEYLSR